MVLIPQLTFKPINEVLANYFIVSLCPKWVNFWFTKKFSYSLTAIWAMLMQDRGNPVPRPYGKKLRSKDIV